MNSMDNELDGLLPKVRDHRRILVSRRRGGLGDIVCCEVAVRATKLRYPDAEIVYCIDDPYFTIYYDQHLLAPSGTFCDKILCPDPWEDILELIAQRCDLHLELDGPEVRHQAETQYNISESRIETWCKYVDYLPTDMCPRWYSTTTEKQKMIAMLGNQEIYPFNYVVVQWSSAESKKDYTHMEELVRLLQKQGTKVIVTSLEEVPDVGALTVISWYNLRDLFLLAELATLVVGPDSSMQHIAAAVKTPSVGLFGPTNPELYLKHYPLSSYLWNTNTLGKDCEKTTPCFGVTVRNHWCRNRTKAHPWCLEQISPEQVVDKINTQIANYSERGFYRAKSKTLFANESKLLIEPDPKVSIRNFTEVFRTRPMRIPLRDIQATERQILNKGG